MITSSIRKTLLTFWLAIYLWWQVSKSVIKPYLKPTMFISFGIAYMITNGWAYVFLFFDGLRFIGSTYIAILWLPIFPEKILTVAIALWLQKILFRKKVL